MNTTRYIINKEALLKYSLPIKGENGWLQPKLSGRQLGDLKKHVTRGLQLEWPLADTKKQLPEKQPKHTIWERNQIPRQKKIKESVDNMPKLIAEKLKASVEKKKKEIENNLTALIPNYLPGGPYGNNDSPKVMALRKIAAQQKLEKRNAPIALASFKGKKQKKTK
ncbi:hypothetical protein DICPUDRAFT_149923 [Dictyostelium purpureum]|uniref:MRPL25 domain-containing protein n=1 Tax=Dictyostelium purpureum TaxID=5786 RepID=F0ZF04_DICPU|nr:uncharacterized protein DICPUDRAFT_149923 [Dictyostelium purpureum]EGC37454.1 hypothetical protein DICPUDRAFT_149923 [Dictyostelium purpureum]|eukprot:XP_003286018.1 hypothetical protein DICPUDRAFT_149923 [Dictyostelium purpureum]